MACVSCGTGGCGTSGCGSSGGCASGGCNRLNTFDWLAAMDIHDELSSEIVEVSFKSGSSKTFFNNPPHTHAVTGDYVVVDTGNGFDIGKISLSGDLVLMQMKKKGFREDTVMNAVLRKANERDLLRLQEAREREQPMIVQARVISRSLGLEMKICDIEVQADHRKATFFYTADGRVDFRELIKHFAKDFKVKVEMRQIGARQESARIGGIGSCGRELCCSTWLSDFKSVSTTAARYQNIAINQTKLSGQCGRLKCCLNYELDVYMDALEEFPERADRIQTEAGTAVLIKTDIFKGLLFYAYTKDNGRGKIFPLEVAQVKSIIENAKSNKLVASLEAVKAQTETAEEIEESKHKYEDVTGAIELPPDKRKKKKKKNKNRNPNKPEGTNNGPNNGPANNSNNGSNNGPTNRPPNNGPNKGPNKRPDHVPNKRPENPPTNPQ